MYDNKHLNTPSARHRKTGALFFLGRSAIMHHFSKLGKFTAILCVLAVLITAVPFSGLVANALKAGDSSSFTKKYVKYNFIDYFTFVDALGTTRSCGSRASGGLQAPLFNLNDGSAVYCMEIDQHSDASQLLNASTIAIDQTTAWKKISLTGQEGIKRTLIYGYPNYTGDYNSSGASNYEKQFAVQMMVWEWETGKRTAYTGDTCTLPNAFNKESLLTSGDITIDFTKAYNYYKGLRAAVANHRSSPSLNKTSVTLNAGQSVNITDANSLLNNFTAASSNTAVATATITSANNLKITAGSKAGSATITLTKKLTKTSGALCLTGAGQNLVWGAISDPVSVPLSISVSYGSCALTKTSDDGVKAGFVFTLTKSDGMYTANGTTDGNGKITWTGLQPGTYTVTEKLTTAQTGKYQTPASKTVTVTSGATASVSFENKIKLGAVAILKTDDAGTKLSGAQFGVYSSSANASSGTSRIATVTTDTNGTATYGGTGMTTYSLTAGSTYYFKEISAPAGYTLDSNIYSATAKAGTVTYAVNSAGSHPVDTRQGKVRIIKKDADGNALGAGYVFGVYSNSACTAQVTSVTTGSDGTITSGWLNPGTYYVKEKSLPSGDTLHELNTSVFTVTVKAGQTAAVTVSNPFAKGAVGIIKANSSGTRLAGAVFGIYSSAANANIGGGSALATVTTNASGAAVYGQDSAGKYTLRHGTTYYIREVSAPHGYMLDNTVYTVTVAKNTVTYANSGNPVINRGFGAVGIKKSDGSRPLEGARFGLYTDETCLADSLIAEAVSDALGNAVFGINESEDNPFAPYELREGTVYFIKEISAPIGYTADTGIYSVSVVPGTTTYANSGNPVVNIPGKGGIRIEKTDSFGNHLSGIKFGIYSDRNCSSLVYQGLTDSGGYLYYGGTGTAADPYTLSHGTTYYIKELETVAPYILDQTVYTVTVTDKKTVTVKIVNTSTAGALEIRKYSEDGNTEGFTFRISGTSSSGETIDQSVTTGAPGTYEVKEGCTTKTYTYDYSSVIKYSIPPGTYTVEEILTPDQASVYTAQGIKTVTVTANNTALCEIHNVLFKGAVGIRKVDEKGNPMQGVVFELREYKNGCSSTLIGTVTTDANGEAVYGGHGTASDPYTLDYTTKGYYFVEKSSRTGYFVSSDEIPVDYRRNTITWANDGTAVVNYPYGGITVEKKDDNGDAVQDAEFALVCASDSSLETVQRNMDGTSFRGSFLTSAKQEAAYILLSDMTGMSEAGLKSLNYSDMCDIVEPQTGYDDLSLFTKSLTDADLDEAAGLAGYADWNAFLAGYVAVLADDAISQDIDYWAQRIDVYLRVAGYDTTGADASVILEYLRSLTGLDSYEAFAQSRRDILSTLRNGGLEAVDDITAVINYGFTSFEDYRDAYIRMAFTILRTDSDGHIYFGGSGTDADPYTLNPYYKCMVIELSVPEGYQLDSTPRYVSVSSGESAVYTVVNNAVTGRARVIKTSEDNNVEGFEFILEGEADIGRQIRIESQSDENGIADFGDVPVGTYTITEKPVSGYVVQNAKTVTVTANEIAEVSFYNALAKGGAAVFKTDDAGNPVEGAVFELFADSECTESIETAATNSSGRAFFGGSGTQSSPYTLIENKTYYVKEKSAPAGLAADTEVYSVTIKKDITSYINGGEPIVNVRKGGIAISKTDDIGNPVSGAVFGLYRDAECQTVIAEVSTDSSGIAYYGGRGNAGDPFLLLPDSVWYMKEKTAPAGYVINNTVFDVTVAPGVISYANNGGSVVNTRMGAVGIYKTDNDNEPLEGVIFGLYSDPDCETKITEISTDANGYAVYGGAAAPYTLVPGTIYYFRELQTQDGYILDENVYEATVTAGETVIANNGEAVVNHKMGSVRIIKTAEDGNVTGFRFTLTGNDIERTGITDENGEILIEDLMPGTYTVTENLTDAQKLRYTCTPEEQQVAVVADNTAVVTFVNTLNTSGLRVVKTSEDGNVEGFVFELTGTTSTGAEVSMTGTTNEAGVILFEDLKPGNYTIAEILDENQSEIYICRNNSQNAVLADGETVILNFTNDLKKGNIKIYKSSEDGVLSGFEFRLTGTSLAGTVIDVTARTDETGVALFENIPVSGSVPYTIEEVNAPARYTAIASQQVTVAYERTSELRITNTLIRGSVILIKYDADYPENKLTGAEFTLYSDVNGNGHLDEGETEFDTLTETEEGVYTLSGIPYGRYILMETKAPNHFKKDENRYAVSIVNTDEILIENTPGAGFLDTAENGSLKIIKRSEDGNVKNISFRITGTDLTGHGYDKTFATNESGMIVIENLRPGSYTVSEVSDENNRKYVLPADKTAVIEADSQTEITFENILIRSNITGVKRDEDGKLLSGVVFGLYDKDKNLITTATTENGEFRFENIPYGEYVIKEITPLEGFVLDETEYAVNIRNNSTVAVNIAANRYATGDIIGHKKDANAHALKGARFGLFKETDTDFDEDNAILTAVSGNDGIFRFENIRYGRYIIRELAAPDGFVRSDSSYSAVIDSDGCEKEITVTNIPVTGSVRTTKVDEAYPENRLTGAVFEIYKDVNGNRTYDADTDMLTGEMTEVVSGIYTRENLVYGGYFLHEKQAPEGFAADDAFYYFDIRENGVTVDVGNNAGNCFADTPLLTDLVIRKTSSDGKLDGFAFRVRGLTAGGIEYDRTFKTDENGEIRITGLRYGEYTVSEVANEASAAYRHPEDQSVVLDSDSSCTLEFYNYKNIPVDTGVELTSSPYVILLTICSAGLVAAITVMILKKKKKEG